MKLKMLILTVVAIFGWITMTVAEANPSSTNAADVELPLSWADGTIYVSSHHDNDRSFERPGIWTLNPTATTNITDWDEQNGGTGMSSSYSGNPYFAPYNYQMTWTNGLWPEFGMGKMVSVLDGGSNTIEAPDDIAVRGALGYGSINYTDSRYIPWAGMNDNVNIQVNDQKVLTMLTGGDSTSGDNELYVFSGRAETIEYVSFPPGDDYTPAVAISAWLPSQQIEIGNYGSLDTNGNLYVVLPKHKKPVVTPHAKTSKYTYINISAQACPLISQCVASSPANQGRNVLGVGEQVALYFNPGLPQNATWSTTAGGLALTVGKTNLFTAPSNAVNSVTITAVVYGKPVKKSFQVFEPKGIVRAQISGTNNYPLGIAGAGMTNVLWIGPTNVSFYRISVLEIGEDATSVYGYFTNYTTQQLHHNPADWTPLSQANQLIDRAFTGSYSFWGSGGGFTWNIPQRWQVIGSGVTNSMPGSTQIFSFDSNGTARVDKYGNWVQRTTNNVITTN